MRNGVKGSCVNKLVTSHFMKRIIFILFLLTSLASYGQTCDTIDGQQINCIDSNGQKQGFWKERKKILLYSSYSGLGSKEGCQYKEVYRYLPGAEGQYKDNKKTGTWKFYGDNEHLISVEKEITFGENGTVKEENFRDSSVIEFNKDTSVVTGYIYYNGDTINLKCIDKKCTFKLNPNREISTFEITDFNKFDYELLRLKFGMYDRKIKEIKTNH